jgi:hypothetical protein
MAYTTINKSTDYFDTKLYTGNATDDRSITGVGFQPDFSWVKRRDSAGSHRLKDSIRGATKTLISNSTSAESTEANVFQAFEADGFQLGSDSVLNASGATYASWNWLGANGTASNTDGSITSTVSANTTSGFSIVKWTGNNTGGATVGHGLGAVPAMIIFRNYSITENWTVYHKGLSSNNHKVDLDGTDAEANVANPYMENTTPTSSLITLGDHSRVNGSGNNIIAYCFAEKTGYSKFGSYTGNGSSDGSFCYLGFKPAFLILKNTSSTGNWVMYDDKRSAVPDANINNRIVNANSSADYEFASGSRTIDTLSNGFKIRGTASDTNTSGNNYIYMAFASAPLVGTNNVPCTAR